MLTTIRRAEYFELVVLFFIHAMAMGMWFVPLGAVLDAHGMSALKPYAFATSALAAFVSPLIFGAMADRHASPVVVLRGLGRGHRRGDGPRRHGHQRGGSPWLVLALIQLHSLCTAPTFSISTAIIAFAPAKLPAGVWSDSRDGHVRLDGRLLDHQPDQRGHLRRGRLCGGDRVAGGRRVHLLLPTVPPPKSTGPVTLRQRLGWDALALLKNRDHRVVFITAALFNIPLAAMFPFTPTHLRELGLTHTTAWLSLGQITEIIAMFMLAGLLTRWRVKWILAVGLALGVVRYSLCALDTKFGALVGISLHGCAYTLV